jgi:transcriptional regulator with XRE-family HTH domain
MEFSAKLRALRDRFGAGQAELAERAGLSPNKLQRYERSNQKPKGDDALSLARALGVTTDYLLDDEQPFPPPEEHLSGRVAIVRKLEGLIAALTERDGEGAAADGGGAAVRAAASELFRVPVFRLGAGYRVGFDAAGEPTGDRIREMTVEGAGDGDLFAVEWQGSSMQSPGGAGFAPGEVLVFEQVTLDEIAPGDYAYVRLRDTGLFRQVFFAEGRLRLRALNPADPEITVARLEVLRVARLVRRIKDY